MQKDTKSSRKSAQHHSDKSAKKSDSGKKTASKRTEKKVEKAGIIPLRERVKSIPENSPESVEKRVVSPTIEKFKTIREGLPYTAIDKLSKRLNTSVKSLLPIFELAQTTYNKKKRDGELMGRRDSETVLYLNELIDYGIEVFDDEEEKFLDWIRKTNLSLGGVTPESLFDSLTGMREVKGCLDRIEYGNMS